MPGIVTNQLAQQQQGAAQQASLSSQLGQQSIWDTILQNFLGLSQDPQAQGANVNWMMGAPTGTGGGIYGNLTNQMNAVAGTVPGTEGLSPAIQNQILGGFQQPVFSEASGLYYDALKNALGVQVPVVGGQSQMQIRDGSTNAFATGVGSGMGAKLAGG